VGKCGGIPLRLMFQGHRCVAKHATSGLPHRPIVKTHNKLASPPVNGNP
jgi:hypothetical protein